MSYTPTNWENGKTPINATNLNNMESGIKDNSDRLDTVESTLSGQTTKISNVEQTTNNNSDRLDAVEGSVGNIETELTEVNNRLNNISEEVDLTEIEASIDTINGKIGTTDISDVGDGTMTGAIRELVDNPSSGGGSGDTSIWISQAEYDALSEEEKEKDVDYYIYDADGDGNAFTTPFSSEKYEAENVGDALNEVKEAVNTANSNLDKLHQTFSGEDLNTILDIANGFCDGACANIPNAGVPGFLEVIRRNDTNIVMQRFTQNSDKRVFTRSYVGGTWSAWVGGALNSDLEYTNITITPVSGITMASTSFLHKRKLDNSIHISIRVAGVSASTAKGVKIADLSEGVSSYRTFSCVIMNNSGLIKGNGTVLWYSNTLYFTPNVEVTSTDLIHCGN